MNELLCQKYCYQIYSGHCQFFIYDKKEKLCQLFDYPINDFAKYCNKIGGSRFPDLSDCSTQDEIADNPCVVSIHLITIHFFESTWCNVIESMTHHSWYDASFFHHKKYNASVKVWWSSVKVWWSSEKVWWLSEKEWFIILIMMEEWCIILRMMAIMLSMFYTTWFLPICKTLAKCVNDFEVVVRICT